MKELIEYLAKVWKFKYYDAPALETKDQERNRAVSGAGYALAIKDTLEFMGRQHAHMETTTLPEELWQFLYRNQPPHDVPKREGATLDMVSIDYNYPPRTIYRYSDGHAWVFHHIPQFDEPANQAQPDSK